MSKILGLIVILLICVSCNQKRKAEMSLSSYTHDFGIISRPLKSTHLRDIARKQCPADFFNK